MAVPCAAKLLAMRKNQIFQKKGSLEVKINVRFSTPIMGNQGTWNERMTRYIDNLLIFWLRLVSPVNRYGDGAVRGQVAGNEWEADFRVRY